MWAVHCRVSPAMKYAGLTFLLLCVPAWADDKPTLEELDARCEAAREAQLQPEREREIAACKAEKRNDPEWCERYYKDLGEGGRNLRGAAIPRKYDDLPECQAAQEARRTTERR